MEKVQKTKSNQNWKILRMTFSKISKPQKWPPKHPKSKKQKIQNVIEGGLKSKKFRKQDIIRIKKY